MSLILVFELSAQQHQPIGNIGTFLGMRCKHFRPCLVQKILVFGYCSTFVFI